MKKTPPISAPVPAPVPGDISAPGMPEGMNDALRILRILGHPVRLGILCALIERGEMSAGEIVTRMNGGASQSQISQYLKILRDDGLVESRKSGLFVHYSIKSDDARRLIALLHDLYCRG